MFIKDYLRLELDKTFFRASQLEDCKTIKQKDRLEDRWALDDRAEKIANSISDVASSLRRRWFLF